DRVGEEVKKEFQWIWESVEDENESVKLVFYGRKNKVMYDDGVLLGEVFDDCEGDLDAIMIVSLAGNEVEDEGDVYHQFSVFNNFVKIKGRGNAKTNSVKDLKEQLKPVLAAMGFQSPTSFLLDQKNVMLNDRNLLHKVPQDEIINVSKWADAYY
ncbi:hypothetical protein L195_g057406, partial [Trifolium pratense]